MTDMPARIWAVQYLAANDDLRRRWTDDHPLEGTQYVRADIAKALAEALQDAIEGGFEAGCGCPSCVRVSDAARAALAAYERDEP